MKNVPIAFVLIFSVLACRKTAAPADVRAEISSPAPYDTTAVDSFSAGASPRIISVVPDSLAKKKPDSTKVIKKDKEKP